MDRKHVCCNYELFIVFYEEMMNILNHICTKYKHKHYTDRYGFVNFSQYQIETSHQGREPAISYIYNNKSGSPDSVRVYFALTETHFVLKNISLII